MREQDEPPQDPFADPLMDPASDASPASPASPVDWAAVQAVVAARIARQGLIAGRRAAFAAVQARLNLPAGQGKSGRNPLWRHRAIGAILAALAIIAVMVYRPDIVHIVTGAEHRVPPSAQQYVTRTGQRATVMLTDGSRVQLAPQSMLRVEPGFGTKARVISLRGEAYFDVPHAASVHTPFIVRTGTTTVQVLGTAFNVHGYLDERVVQVTVVTGKVNVIGTDYRYHAVTLTAGMTGIVRDSVAMVTPTDDANRSVAWITGRLVFHQAPPAEVLAALTRWYGYQFRLADSALAHRNVTLGLNTESAAAALATLKQVMDVELAFDGNIITLSPRRATHHSPQIRRAAPEVASPTHTEAGR